MINEFNPGAALPAIEKSISQDKINQWARISGDYNRLHVDPEYAKKTPFGGTIAHGPMSLAFLNQLMMDCFGRGWAHGGKLFGVRFQRPIKDGDKITISGKITAVREEGGRKIVECDLFIDKADGTRAVVGCGSAYIE